MKKESVTENYGIYRQRLGEGALSTEDMLRLCAATYAPEASCQEIARTPEGKPWFPQAPEIFCSVTHSGEWWVGVLARRPVGVDLQNHRPCNAADIAQRFFHPEEVEWLEELNHEPEEFFRIWTAKESYSKLTGKGLAEGFESFSVLSPDFSDRFCYLPFLPGYTLCLCF